MKLSKIIVLILLYSVEITINYEDFVHACMTKIAVDSGIPKLKQITNATAKNLGDDKLFKDISFKNLTYYEIANYPDKAKSQAKKDKKGKGKTDTNIVTSTNNKTTNSINNDNSTNYTQEFLEKITELSENEIKNQLKSRRDSYCLGAKVNEFQGVDLRDYECYYDFHFSTEFVNFNLTSISVNGASSLDDIKEVTDEKANQSRNQDYWKTIPSLYGFLDKTLDY